jgi:DNA-binding transcriptional MerR regulator
MKTCSISKLAQAFGLSRSTLLYYDRLGLLPPSGQTGSGYRCYTDKDHLRLERICHFREAGLTLKEIRAVLSSGGKPGAKLLEQRMRETAARIQSLRNQQRLLAGMLSRIASGKPPPVVDVELWVEMLEAAGMDENARERWHAEFERRAPEGGGRDAGLNKRVLIFSPAAPARARCDASRLQEAGEIGPVCQSRNSASFTPSSRSRLSGQWPCRPVCRRPRDRQPILLPTAARRAYAVAAWLFSANATSSPS